MTAAMGRIVLPVLALLALLTAACGPIRYIGDVTRGASTAVDQARDAHADRYSPYHWTRAVQYLHAAREDAARADWQGANHFGRLSRESAELATNESEVAAKEDGRPPAKVAPAKDTIHAAPAKDDDAPAPATNDKGTP